MEEMIGDVAEVRVTVNASPSAAYERLADVTKWRDWRKTDPKASWKTGTKASVEVGDVFTWYAGAKITSTITEAVLGERIAWKGSTLGGLIKAHHRWQFVGLEDGKTEVIITEAFTGCLKFLVPHSTAVAVNEEWGNELVASFEV